MRLIERVERAFVRRIVDDTRQLSESERPVHEKIARLQFSAAIQAHRIDRLGSRVGRLMQANPLRFERARRVLELRRKALGYMKSTAKFLLHRDRHPRTLCEQPPLFAGPSWEREKESEPAKEPELKFMEYSS